MNGDKLTVGKCWTLDRRSDDLRGKRFWKRYLRKKLRLDGKTLTKKGEER